MEAKWSETLKKELEKHDKSELTPINLKRIVQTVKIKIMNDNEQATFHIKVE